VNVGEIIDVSVGVSNCWSDVGVKMLVLGVFIKREDDSDCVGD